MKGGEKGEARCCDGCAPPEFHHLEPLNLPTVLTPIHKNSGQRFARYRKTAFTEGYIKSPVQCADRGRGTGKSTILEYLRWALCDQPPDVTAEDAPNYQSRRMRLIEQTLRTVNATVDVRFVINEVPHVVRRHSRDGSILIKVGSDDFRECAEDKVRTLLPIQAYSQKQLSDVSVRKNELTRFVISPVRSRLRQIQSRIDDAASRVRQSYATRLRQRTLLAEIERRNLEQRSLQEQADTLAAC